MQKIVIFKNFTLWQYESEMTMQKPKDILVLTDISEGTKIRLIRLAKGLRQIDLASQAGVQPIDITRLEHDRYVLPTRRKRILAALGLLDDENETENRASS